MIGGDHRIDRRRRRARYCELQRAAFGDHRIGDRIDRRCLVIEHRTSTDVAAEGAGERHHHVRIGPERGIVRRRHLQHRRGRTGQDRDVAMIGGDHRIDRRRRRARYCELQRAAFGDHRIGDRIDRLDHDLQRGGFVPNVADRIGRLSREAVGAVCQDAGLVAPIAADASCKFQIKVLSS